MNTQIGKIRFVNPERPPAFVAEVIEPEGYLSVRTFDFQSFGIYCVRFGKEFWCGREFSKQELFQFCRKEFTHPGQERQDDFGEIPATGWEDPRRWKWRAFTSGEIVLDREHRPTADMLSQAAELALNELEPGKRYPDLDEWECWVCDKETKEPIALVLTATDQDSIETLTYSPMVRLGRGDLSFDFTDFKAARDLQDRINARINTATEAGRFGYFVRIFRREIDGSATEFRPDKTTADHPAGYLPTGLLAEPWETERLSLKAAQPDQPEDEWPDEVG